MRGPSILTACALAITSVWGCTPSLRMVHQSTSYFEQCHAADLDTSRGVNEKRDCWDAWLTHYTIGQTPERVRHARTRIAELERGESVPQLPGTAGAETAAFMATTQAHLPESASDATSSEPTPATVPATPAIRRSPPSSGDGPCHQVCNPRWDICIDRCGTRGSRCVVACEAEHRTCMSGCF